MNSLPPFDELKRLAQEDPEQLQALQDQLSEAIIAGASPEMQPRLRAQYHHIKQVSAHSANPLHATVKLMGELNVLLHRLNLALNEPQALQRHQAAVLPLTPRKAEQYNASNH